MLHHGMASAAVPKAKPINEEQAGQIHITSRNLYIDRFNYKLLSPAMIVCADDYGLRDDINRAVLELVRSGRLSAVSCLVAFERCTPEALTELCTHGSRIDIGLHLCLTNEDLPLSTSLMQKGAGHAVPSYRKLLRKALLGRLEAGQVEAQVAEQYELFRHKCGRRPDFIDGHLHVHQLPGARQGVVQFVRSLPSEHRPYVRNTHLALRELRRRGLPWVKAGFIGAFGTRLADELRVTGLPTNDGFAGIYDFRNSQRYAAYFPRFAACLTIANGILVVHPGLDEEWRAQEFKVLKDFSFAAGQPNRFRPEVHLATRAMPCA
jgi:hypothetical protein